MASSTTSGQAGAPAPNKLSAKSAGVVSIAVACSRVLGLVREQVFASMFGAGVLMDAFNAAFRAPNLLRDLFAEGALSTAFVTVFSKKIATEGDDSAWRLANKIATLAVVFMSLVTLLGIWLAPHIISVLAGGFPPEKAALTVTLTRIMFPFILLVSLAALAMGMLNARKIFGMPAMASSFFNLGSIIGGVVFGYWLDPSLGEKAIMGLAFGTLLGGLLQLVVQFPSLWKVGFRFKPDLLWRDSGVKEVIVLMIPAVIAASAVQVNVAVNGNFASHLGDGPVSWLQYAFRLMQLPLGMFGVAVGTVTLPVVARFAAEQDMAGIRNTLARGLRLGSLLTLPSAVGLFFLAEPIMSLIFERGRFSHFDALQSAAALKFYAIGLVAYSGIKVIVPTFYTINKKNMPMYVSFASIAVNYFLNVLITFRLGFGFRGLALSTSLVAVINFAVLYLLLRRYIGGMASRSLLVAFGKLAVACIPLTLVCIGAQHTVFQQLEGMALIPKILGMAGTIFAGMIVFFGTVTLLRIEEMNDVLRILKRKLGKTS